MIRSPKALVKCFVHVLFAPQQNWNWVHWKYNYWTFTTNICSSASLKERIKVQSPVRPETANHSKPQTQCKNRQYYNPNANNISKMQMNNGRTEQPFISIHSFNVRSVVQKNKRWWCWCMSRDILSFLFLLIQIFK